MGNESLQDIRKVGALPINYSGPSTITNLIIKMAAESGIEAIVFIVSLPQYVVIGEDYLGKVRLMEILNMLYNIPVDKEGFEKALEQRKLINERLENSPDIKMLLPQLENAYDMRIKEMEAEGIPHMTFEMDDIFWKLMGEDIGRA
jgi:predicted ATP-grasp superfamily ATP-dependent carboligase